MFHLSPRPIRKCPSCYRCNCAPDRAQLQIPLPPRCRSRGRQCHDTCQSAGSAFLPKACHSLQHRRCTSRLSRRYAFVPMQQIALTARNCYKRKSGFWHISCGSQIRIVLKVSRAINQHIFSYRSHSFTLSVHAITNQEQARGPICSEK